MTDIIRTLSFLPIFSIIQEYRNKEDNYKQVILSMQSKLSGEVKLPIHLYTWLKDERIRLGHKNINETIIFYIEKSYKDDTKKYHGKKWLDILVDNKE